MIKIWGWEKKPRTMRRYIKIGDIFCFKYDDHSYRFGRLLVTPLDTYSLFDRRSEGEWRIVGHQEDYVPEDAEDIWFSWGDRSGCRKSNVLDQTVFISEEEWSALPPLSPGGDHDVKQEIADKLAER